MSSISPALKSSSRSRARDLAAEEVEEVVNTQHDILRYTMVIRTKRYTKAVAKIIAVLEAGGYITCKNKVRLEGDLRLNLIIWG